MEIITALKIIKTALSTARTIQNIARPEVVDLLNQLGDVHASAAKRVLKNDIAFSKAPEHQLREVITHLNASIEHQIAAAQKLQRKLILFISYEKVQEIRKKTIALTTMIASCYHLLGENELKLKYFMDARSIFYAYAESIALPGNGKWVDKGKYLLEEEEKDLLQLAEALGVEIWPPTCRFRDVEREILAVNSFGQEDTVIAPVTEIVGRWSPPAVKTKSLLQDLSSRKQT